MLPKLESRLAVVLFLHIFPITLSEPGTEFKPTTLSLPLQKDSPTSLHVVHLNKMNCLIPLPFVVDLNAGLLWESCTNRFLSSPNNFPQCHSTQCARANIHSCRKCPSKTLQSNCHNNTCAVVVSNPLTRRNVVAELAQDMVSIQFNQGSNPGPMLTIPQFLFACAPSTLLQGPFPKNVRGVIGLGQNPISFPNQLASRFGLSPQFALCLTSIPSAKGVVFFGNRPYVLQPGIDVSNPATYTPLVVNSRGEYFIQVSSIRINGKKVPFDALKSKQGISPKTIISTTNPYTILKHSIYTKFTQFFASQLLSVPQVKPPVSPFGLCFDSTKLSATRVGPGVPTIDLVLHNNNATWSIYGANSMVQARPGVACLGFVDGGTNPGANIVIGTYQFEDNLVQFDLARSRLGVSSSLLFRHTNCASYNVSSSP